MKYLLKNRIIKDYRFFCRPGFYKHETLICFNNLWSFFHLKTFCNIFSSHCETARMYRNRVLCSIYSAHTQLSGIPSFRLSTFEPITCNILSFSALLWVVFYCHNNTLSSAAVALYTCLPVYKSRIESGRDIRPGINLFIKEVTLELACLTCVNIRKKRIKA